MIQVYHLVLLCSAASLGAALLAVVVLLLRVGHVAANRVAPLKPLSGRTIFLVEGRSLLDATGPGREFLACRGAEGSDFDRLERALAELFPDFTIAAQRSEGPRVSQLVSPDRMQTLTIAREGPRLRIEVGDGEGDLVEIDRGCHATLEAELNALRAIGDSLPYPVWRQDRDGQIRWANAAYLDLVRDRDPGEASSWPPPMLFDRLDPGVARQRIQVAHRAGSDEGWFDCACMISDTEVLVSACPADALMAAETSLRDSVQTFSRTFAHLTVGMAVFDRRRQLQLFNPALTELTNLPVDLLIARPTLDSFLDALRARKTMPEPKNYTSWREAVAKVERGAADGTYSEMWHLPGNRTYRVTGRPQHGGAFALLIEDISAEISLTRRFRTEIQTGHAILNSLEDAICVFDGAGILLLGNAAYERLWNLETLDGMAQLTVREALATWRTATAPSALWDEAQTFLSHDTERAPWSREAQMADGRPLCVTFSPLPGGATVVRFVLPAAARSADMTERLAQPGARERLEA